MIKTCQRQKSISSEKIHEIIKELKRIDLSKEAYIPSLKNKINLLLNEYAHTSIVVPIGWGKFHRAIKYKNQPAHIKQLGYPSENIELNRANFRDKPMFYCSGNPSATFFELKINPGDTIVLSKWMLKNEVLLFPVGYSDASFRKLNASRDCPIIIPNENRHPNELKKSNIQISEFLADVFTQKIPESNKHPYQLTATIAEFFLKTKLECGLVYPSIATHANAENIAFTPQLVDLSMQVVSANWYRVDKIHNFSYTLTSLAYADSFSNDGLIHWRMPTGEERKYL